MSIAIVFGLVCALLQFLAWQSDGRAADDAEQLIRIRSVESNLLHADALATNAFLVGGLEDPDQREQYDTAINDVFTDITDAAKAQPADREALAALIVEINDYTDAVAQARVNNRQGFPVGAEYLSGASAALRAEAMPILTNLADANTERTEDAMGGQHPIWLLLLGVLALVGLWWLNRQLAQHFRRRINVGFAVAAGIVLVVTLVAVAAAYRGDSQNDSLLSDELDTATRQAIARTAGNDAKALESLRLIKRGSGELYEEPWRTAAAVVVEKAVGSTDEEWTAYADFHEAIVKLDERDRWFSAVIQATARDEDDNETADTSTAAFEAFDNASERVVDTNGTKTSDELRSGRGLALAGSAITLLLGIVAAVAVARGIGARRKEYA
ncbi:hypothetical protein HNR19_001375 [Nocardioides thalensis]|uniref:Chemotaxis methyl-accepting receptor HlyB-like 4HB MCP domain-containing protein n=1 Tax=Nocardioides thalensis TaxID=1914755 RepID=A0A853C0J9_9ACTN|nr:hypothetical protein [Nocardioides thalensis]NYJ00677.1 hypothetical protein [Nocardioides thalensis]